MVFRNKPILAAAVLLGRTLGNHTPDHISGMNGEEYCEGPDMITNAEACQASTCCHWNTWEPGEASFDGQGRCWSSIGQGMCEESGHPDGHPGDRVMQQDPRIVDFGAFIKSYYEDTPMEELYGTIWKDLELLAEDLKDMLEYQHETNLQEMTDLVQMIHQDLNIDLDELPLLLEDVHGAFVLDLTILKEELEDDFENMIEDIEEGLGSMNFSTNFTNGSMLDFGELELDLQDDLQDIMEDITEALFGDLANAFNTAGFNMTGFNMTAFAFNMTAPDFNMTESGCPQHWIGDSICDPLCNNAADAWDGGDCGDNGPDLNTTENLCQQHWIGDSICDPLCNNAANDWDDGDCGNNGPDLNTTENVCPQHWIGDSICDAFCNNAANDWDGGDCGNHGPPDLNTTFLCLQHWIGDGVCDSGCYNADNLWDGGDCADNGVDLNTTGLDLNTTDLDLNTTDLEDLFDDLDDILDDLKGLEDILEDLPPVSVDECWSTKTKDICDGDSNCVWSSDECQMKGTVPVCVLTCSLKCLVEHNVTNASCDCVDACDKSACDQAGVGMVDDAVAQCRAMAALIEEHTSPTTIPGVAPEPTDNQKQGKCKSYDNRKECRAAGCRFKRRKNKCVMKKKDKKKNKNKNE